MAYTKTIALIANPKADGVCSAAAEVRGVLEALGARVCSSAEPDVFPPADTDALLARGDLAIALGGDGTIIHIAACC